MSFLKKLQEKFEDVVGDDKKKKEATDSEQPANGYSQRTDGVPPPPQGSAPPGPQLPPGWVSQWDPASQRYYFLEQATGRSQWEPPSFQLPPNAPPQGPPTGYYQQTQTTTHEIKDGKEKKKENKSGMWKGAAGGLAVGAVGGALVGHALGDDSSDDEHKSHAATYQPTYGTEPTYYREETTYVAAPAPMGDNHSVSSSDREDLEEARRDYENASASDKESAREEYEEQYEETYGSD